MTFRTETTTKKCRKSHRCEYCGGTIPAGSPSINVAGHWDGDFYSARGHTDCVAMWNDAYKFYADEYEGMVFDLHEAIGDCIGGDEYQAELNGWRGKYPHVVCRLELRQQRGDIAYAARCRAAGFEPDPKDCPEIYG